MVYKDEPNWVPVISAASRSNRLSHQLSERAPRNGDPQPWTRRELGIIMGPALLEYEANQPAWNEKVAQEKKNRGLRSPSVVRLMAAASSAITRLCGRTAICTSVAMKSRLTKRTGPAGTSSTNTRASKLKARSSRSSSITCFSIRPANPGSGYIHFNPETGLPYVDIRKQRERLMRFANRMLGDDLEDKKRTFLNFRHTGASHIAQRGKTPAHSLAVVQMMGDTSVATVNRITSGWSRN